MDDSSRLMMHLNHLLPVSGLPALECLARVNSRDILLLRSMRHPLIIRMLRAIPLQRLTRTTRPRCITTYLCADIPRALLACESQPLGAPTPTRVMGHQGIVHSQGHSHRLTLTLVAHMEACPLRVHRVITCQRLLGLRLRPSLASIFRSGPSPRLTLNLPSCITLICNPPKMVLSHSHRSRTATGKVHPTAHSRRGPGRLRLTVLVGRARLLGDIRTPLGRVQSLVASTLCMTLSRLMRLEAIHP